MWEDERTREPLLALLRSAVTNEAAAAMLRQFVGSALLGRLADGLTGPDAQLRVEAAVGQLLGTALLRYVLLVEPIASLPVERLVPVLAPAVQQHLAPGS